MKLEAKQRLQASPVINPKWVGNDKYEGKLDQHSIDQVDAACEALVTRLSKGLDPKRVKDLVAGVGDMFHTALNNIEDGEDTVLDFVAYTKRVPLSQVI